MSWWFFISSYHPLFLIEHHHHISKTYLLNENIRSKPTLILKILAQIMFGISIGCIIAKTNIHVCVAGYYVATCVKHFFKILDTMFQHPGTV
jgi:hypothetical protein